MKLPKPGDPPPTAREKLYISLIGDKDELVNEAIGHVVYNYDNPSEHLQLVVSGPDNFVLFSTHMPCCGSVGEADTEPEELAGGVLAIDVVIRCPQCEKTFDPVRGKCMQHPATPNMKKFRTFEERGCIYVMHHDKHLGLLPGGAYSSNEDDHLRHQKVLLPKKYSSNHLVLN